MTDINITNSTNPFDYEILIRKRGENQYASYCPQLNQMLLGNEHNQVAKMMEDFVLQHIETLKAQNN